MRRGWSAVVVAAVLLVPAGVRAQGSPSATGTPPAASSRAVPILLYHHIGSAPRRAARDQIALYVPAATLRRQLAAVAAAGYEAVTLDDVVAAWRGTGTLPDKPVVVSFDDGYGSQYRGALPVLRARGWPGVLNLIVDNPFPDAMSRAQVRGLLAAGWELDAHTLTHPDLTKVPHARLVREVADARTRLQEAYGVPVNFLAYPYGRVDARVVDAVRDAGYLGATTTQAGLASPSGDPDRLPRIIAGPRTTPDALVKKLQG